MNAPKTSIDELHNFRILSLLTSKHRKVFESSFAELNDCYLSPKHIFEMLGDVTYRKINDWDEKGLVSGSRTNKETGWRRFSLIDVVKIQILADLRILGFTTEQIAHTLAKIQCTTATATISKSKEKIEIPAHLLEWFVALSLAKIKILLLIYPDGKPFFSSEEDAIRCHFTFENTTPVIILPFFAYVQNLTKNLTFREKTTIQGLLNNVLSLQEKEVIEIIRNNDFKEITLTKSNGCKLKAKAVFTLAGNLSKADILKKLEEHDFQNISVTRQDGKNIHLVQEQSIKI